MKIRVAIIGISGYGLVHFEHIRKLADQGKVELAAAVVINPDQVQKQLEILKNYNTKIYASPQEMYADFSGKLDLVCIPTGIAFHEPMTIEALRNGASVLVEKPAAGSVADIEKMQKAEKEAKGKFVAVGFQHTYARELQFIKRYLLTGRLGAIRNITVKGLNSEVTNLVGGSPDELTVELSRWCAVHYPTATEATWNQVVSIDWENGVISTGFTLNGESAVNLTVVYLMDSGAFEFGY